MTVYALVRLASPSWAVLAALACGLGLSFASGTVLPPTAVALPHLLFVLPEWSPGALPGLGLFLVTMAGQNLPGLAVLQGAGFVPPVRKALVVAASGLNAFGIGAAFWGLAAGLVVTGLDTARART